MEGQIKIDMSHVPDAVCGNWRVATYYVSQEEADAFNHPAVNPLMREIVPGWYKRLVVTDKDGIQDTMMSNTPAEISDFMVWANKASGHILINGLGLGVLVTYLLTRPQVESITIIENSQDVVNLVVPYFDDPRLRVVYADAFTWEPEPGERNFWDIVWHDIWLGISSDNLPEMRELLAKYEGRCTYQTCWCMEECLEREKSDDEFFAMIKAAREFHQSDRFNQLVQKMRSEGFNPLKMAV
jgi:hypothetical protein